VVETREQLPRDATPATSRPRPGRRRLGVPAVLLGLVALSAAVRSWGALAVPGPWYTPDEQIYTELGRSLYSHGRFEILGETPDFFGLVYPAFVGLPLSLSDIGLGYDVLRVLQAVVMSLVAVPVYLWGRELMSARWALVAAALSLAAPGLAFTGFVMTEVAFYPVLCFTAWAMARALAVPTAGRQALVVAAVLLAAMTRLQAIVLAPAFFGAVALKVAFDRTWLRGALRFRTAAGGFVLLAALWVTLPLLFGGSALGAYSVTTTETTYGVWDTVRFVLYHAADVVLFTVALPVLAVVLLAVAAARGREPSPQARAYLAVAISISVVFVAAVGLFASRWVGRLAERNLIALGPLLFIGFCLWLDRGAPRPRLATALASAAALALLAFVPWDSFVSRAAQPDAYSVIPLRWMVLGYPELDVRVVVLVAAVEVLALAVLVPSRLRWLMPAALGATLAAASIPTTIEVAREARDFRQAIVGADPGWIDRSADGPVAYVFGGEQPWSLGSPVWEHMFWNRRIDRLYQLFGAKIVGPAPGANVRPAADGRLLLHDGRAAEGEYAVASRRMTFVGQRVAESAAQLALWRVESPLRLSTRTTGVDGSGVVGAEATLVVYDCRGGELALTLRSPAEQEIELLVGETVARTVTLEVDRPWSATIPSAPARSPGPRTCRFGIRGVDRPLRAERLDFVRSG
jgi:hypothetical protein